MSSAERQVRVFISSTFRDMHAERDHLVTVVFPELRERVERLGLEFFDVDLRWGVPARDANGETANSWEYCRQWIDRVEPFFVCILGQRYGWVPEPDQLKAHEDRHRQQDERRSITDMEVRHAVLNTKLKRRSYFYLRATNAPPTASEFVDPPPLLSKLEQLKSEVRSCGRPVRNYPSDWTGTGFARMEEFGRRVLDDLWSGVLRDERYVSKEVWRQVLGKDPDTEPLYTDESQPVPEDLAAKIVARAKPPPKEPLDAEREQMDIFAASRLRWFQGRTVELQQLNDFLNSIAADAPHLAVVAAVPGQGKSALLAHLHEQLKSSPHFVITHFVGATEGSASAHSLVERLLGELDRSGIRWPTEQQEEGQEPKRDFNSLCFQFARRLGDYEGERLVVILLDALDQLSDGHDLKWLPTRLGFGVRVIISCVEDIAAKRESPDHRVLREIASRQDAPSHMPIGKAEVRTTAVVYPMHGHFRGRKVIRWVAPSPPGEQALAAQGDQRSGAQVSEPRPGDSPETSELSVHHALASRQPAPLRVALGALAPEDVRTVVVGYLKEYCHELDREHLDTLCAITQARNPLYLLVMLNELRTLGGNDLNHIIPALIASMPQDHPDTVSLFRWVMERLEVFGPEAVRWWCLYLAYSRVGLASHELADLLARKLGADGAATALRIERGLRRYLLRRGPQLDFFHGQLRQAVFKKYGQNAEVANVHSDIAAYFRDLADPERNKRWACNRPRPFLELPFHLLRGRLWTELAATLEDIFFLDAKVANSLAFDVVENFRDAVRQLPNDHPRHRILSILEEALRRDIHFIARHVSDCPEALFQSLWNSCWWYDCPKGANHYLYLNDDSFRDRLAVAVTTPKLYELLETWRSKKSAKSSSSYWLRSMRPPPNDLGIGQVAILCGHQGSVNCVSFSPNCRTIASGSDDMTLRIWNAETSEELQCVRCHGNAVLSIAFSPDGRRIVCGSDDGSIGIWSTETPQLLLVLTLNGHKKRVLSVAFSPDGHRILSGSEDMTTRIWNAETGEELRCLQGHTSPVLVVGFSLNGQLAISAAKNGMIRGWFSEGETWATWRSNVVTGMSIFPEENKVAVGTKESVGNQMIRMWHANNTNEELWSRGQSSPATCFGFSRTGLRLVCGFEDGSICIVIADTGNVVRWLRGHTTAVKSVNYSPDGLRIASGSSDGTIREWEATRIEARRELRDHAGNVTSVSFLPDGDRVISGSIDRTIRIWNRKTGEQIYCRGGMPLAKCISHSLTHPWVAIGGLDSCVWDTVSHRRLWRFQDVGLICSVSFSSDGQRIAAVFSDRTIHVLQAESGRELSRFRAYELGVLSVAYSPDGRWIVGGLNDSTVRVWDAHNGAEAVVLRGHENPVCSVAYSPDGRRIASRSADPSNNHSAVRVWDTESFMCMEVISGTSDVNAIAAGSRLFPWRAVVRGLETVIEDATTGQSVAHFPAALEHVVTHASGQTWAGAVGKHLCLVTLTAEISAGMQEEQLRRQ